MKEDKFCKNCVYFSAASGPWNDLCKRPVKSLVHGKEHLFVSAEKEREKGKNKCGPNGKFFVLKPVVEEKHIRSWFRKWA